MSHPHHPTLLHNRLPYFVRTGLVRSGLVAEYRFNEGSGQILYDYSGNNNHGTLGSTTGSDTNDPTYTGQGALCTTDDYFTGLTGLGANAAQTLMIVLNFNHLASVNGTHTGICSSLMQHSANNRIYISGQNDFFDTTALITAGVWNCLTFTSSGSTTTAALKVGLTNVACTQQTGDTNEIPALTQIGCKSGVGAYMDGTFAYFIIYNRVLAQAEITQNYNYLKGYLLRERGISI
jgi:hypothetical protein